MPASLLCLRSLAAPNLAISAAESSPAAEAVWLRLVSLLPLLLTLASVSSAGRPEAASVDSCRHARKHLLSAVCLLSYKTRCSNWGLLKGQLASVVFCSAKSRLLPGMVSKPIIYRSQGLSEIRSISTGRA